MEVALEQWTERDGQNRFSVLSRLQRSPGVRREQYRRTEGIYRCFPVSGRVQRGMSLNLGGNTDFIRPKLYGLGRF